MTESIIQPNPFSRKFGTFVTIWLKIDSNTSPISLSLITVSAF